MKHRLDIAYWYLRCWMCDHVAISCPECRKIRKVFR